MAFSILGSPKPAFFDSNGSPLASGTLSVLEPADNSNKTYYPTADDADAGTNGSSGDITLDSRGETPNALFGISGETYKVVLKDSTGATVWTVDDIGFHGNKLYQNNGTVRATANSTGILVTGSVLDLDGTGLATAQYISTFNENGGTAISIDASANPSMEILDSAGDSTGTYFSWGASYFRIPTTLQYNGTPQTLSGAGAVNLTTTVTHVATTGANALTLADGTNGQVKYIVMTVDNGDGTLTPTNLLNGTTITFDDVGDSAHLLFTNSQWVFMGGTATLA